MKNYNPEDLNQKIRNQRQRLPIPVDLILKNLKKYFTGKMRIPFNLQNYNPDDLKPKKSESASSITNTG